ncbi:MAG: ATP-dependent DNA ligase [Euryarchaeota archaeon]|nr:ATP-dependent DNA ligase [Euryarchaeota archaeon]
MLYSRLVEYYERLAATTKRLEMTAILAELFKESRAEEIEHAVNLTMGRLYPDFLGIELGVSERLITKAISTITGVAEDHLDQLTIEKGDIGNAAEAALKGKRQASLVKASALSVADVFSAFDAMARSSGQGSQDARIQRLNGLLRDASPIEARYIVRTVNGKLRLGVAEMSVLDALALAFATKEDRPAFEEAFNKCSDIGAVAREAAGGGLHAVRRLTLRLGVPVRPMLAERLPTSAEILGRMGGRCALELKYDGLRLQAHIAKGKVRFFSRRLEDVSGQFPDVEKMLVAAFKGRDAVIEGECVGVDPVTGELRPFQDVSRRRGRKHDLEKAVAEHPVTLFAFDILYADGVDVTTRPLLERRRLLEESLTENAGVKLSEYRIVSSSEELEAFFMKAVETGAEGIMAKSTSEDSLYRAGGRGFQWVKLKRDYQGELSDTLDLVVIGAFGGQGRRAGRYGALLAAARNDETGRFESVCKIGTGFTDEMLEGLTARLKPSVVDRKSARVDCEMVPDYWFEPRLVLEVVGAELTLSPIHRAAWGSVRDGAGLAVRFPRFTGRIRDDKGPEDATATSELVTLYEAQKRRLGSDAKEA